MEKNRKSNLLYTLVIAALVITVGILAGGIAKNLASENETYTSANPTFSTTNTVTDTTQASPATSTTQSPSTQPSTENTTATAPLSTEETLKTTDEVCNTYNNCINTLKAYKGSVIVHKDEKIDMTITEFSLPAPTEQINSVMRSIVPDTLEDYSFQNGFRTDEPEIGLTDTIPPFGKDASVSYANVSSAIITDTASGQEITLRLIPESSSYDGTVTTATPNMSSVLDPLDFATFEMGPIGIQKAQISYPEATLTAELDVSGRLTRLTVILPVIVSCTGGMSVFTADVGLDMKVTTVYEISYQ
ncbi:MAG: hypothetical protein IJ491_06960 [Clostridia bacterium]|nr:hypothetical protein [Clostridia bacterium]